MAQMGRHERCGAVFTDDCTSPSGLRERGTMAGAPAMMDGPDGRPAFIYNGTTGYWVGHPQPNMQASCTVMGWVYVGAGETTGMIWAKRDNSGKGPTLFVDDTVSAGDLIVLDGGDVWIDSGVNITLGEWHHIAIVVNAAGTSYELYYDGVLASMPRAITAFTANGGQPWSFAADDGGWLPGNVSVRDFQAWDRILTADEILAEKNGTTFDYDIHEQAHWTQSNINDVDISHARNGYDMTGVSLVAGNIVDGPYNGEKMTDYDGSNDYAERVEADWRSGDLQGAVSVMFKRDTTGVWIVLLGSCDTATADEYHWTFGVSAGNHLNVSVKEANVSITSQNGDTTTISSGEWHHAVLSSDGSAYSFYVDGLKQHITTSVGTNTGEWLGDVTERDSVTIGCRKYNAVDLMLNGQISDMRYYNQPLLGIQVADLYSRLRLGGA